MNVSKSQYYEFRHNIMNLGNQNSKYSWRIRDLENPQTGTQFANSVLMYKIRSLQRFSLVGPDLVSQGQEFVFVNYFICPFVWWCSL